MIDKSCLGLANSRSFAEGSLLVFVLISVFVFLAFGAPLNGVFLWTAQIAPEAPEDLPRRPRGARGERARGFGC